MQSLSKIIMARKQFLPKENRGVTAEQFNDGKLDEKKEIADSKSSTSTKSSDS